MLPYGVNINSRGQVWGVSTKQETYKMNSPKYFCIKCDNIIYPEKFRNGRLLYPCSWCKLPIFGVDGLGHWVICSKQPRNEFILKDIDGNWRSKCQCKEMSPVYY